tara:strand:- start:1939 stop:2337 length:399 start_codon:yes stop_codon:yes gene_type:complete
MMKKLFLLIFIALVGINAKADQLACLSESTAKKASKVISQQEFIVLFCGCCDDDTPQIVKVLRTKVIKDCEFQVVITYENMDGEIKSESVDLAYVWMEDPDDNGGARTVGQILKLEHDPCVLGNFVMDLLLR